MAAAQPVRSGIDFSAFRDPKLARELKSMGLTVLIPQTVPVNDGCIAYGQAAVASARLAQTASQ